MVDPKVRYAAALARLRLAERRVAEAETELIEARREFGIARFGSAYHEIIRKQSKS